MKHLPIGGSTATRTINCPAWLERSKELPKGKSGFAADKGNLLHDAMEAFYKGQAFSELVGNLKYADQVLCEDDIEEMLNPAMYATEAVLDTYDIAQLLLEPFVQYEEDRIGGSIDMLGLSDDGKTVLVLDYKFGNRWVSVETEQLPFYGLCAMTDTKTRTLFTDAEKIVFAIVQPARSSEAQIIEHPISVLADFERRLLDALDNPSRSATGKHCEYCPAAPVCPDKIAKAKSALLMSPKTSEALAESLELADEVEAWAKQVKQQAYDIALDGGVIPRFKLVAGRSTRKWNDKAETVLSDKLGDQAFERKLLGITKIEKLLGKGEIEALGIAEKSEAKPNLVPEDAPGDMITIVESENLLKLVDNKLL